MISPLHAVRGRIAPRNFPLPVSALRAAISNALAVPTTSFALSRRLPFLRRSIGTILGTMAPTQKKPRSNDDGDSGMKPPSPSSSVVLLSPSNEVLLLHRVKTSSSFASAHVFPGGNVDPFHDGEVPPEGNPDHHRDGMAYRLCAIRETFEESGILLAKKDGRLIELPEQEKEEARKKIHARQIKFGDWLDSLGAKPDTDSLVPFTRWLTPAPVPKRFTTQMYIYLLPLTRGGGVPSKMVIATADGGVEHTAAVFASPQSFLKQVKDKTMVLFPPQVFLLDIIAKFVGGGEMGALEEESKRFMIQRKKLISYVRKVPTADTDKGKQHPTSNIPWGEKVISPMHLYIRESDNRAVLGLEHPGPELDGSNRGGDWERVVLVKFGKGGPSSVEVRLREEVLAEDEKEQAKL